MFAEFDHDPTMTHVEVKLVKNGDVVGIKVGVSSVHAL